MSFLLFHRLIKSELEVNNVADEFINSAIFLHVSIRFNHTFQNTGINCIEIMNIKAELGPLGAKLLEFEDVYSYLDRDICPGDIWTVPDRRSAVNLCEQSYTTPMWDIILDVDDLGGGTTNMVSNFTWSISPSMAPSIQPSLAPSIDRCTNCTLTAIVSGGKFKPGQTKYEIIN